MVNGAGDAMRIGQWAALFAGLFVAGAAHAQPPVATTDNVCNAVWHDSARDRDMPVRVRLPAGTAKVPVILFSHGLGGSVEAGTRWAADWTAAGFAVVHIQHPGSDAAVWQPLPQPERLAALKAAATAQQLLARVSDVRFAVDTLVAGGAPGGCDLARIDARRIGLAGHSFGAQTVQAAAGQRFPIGGGERSFGDVRIKAFIAFSPSATAAARAADDTTARDAIMAQAFGQITAPFLSVTGTRDASPIDPALSPKSRQWVFAALPRGNDYLLALNDADHMVLGGGNGVEGRLSSSSDTPGIDRVVGQVTTLFWLATLQDSAIAARTLKDLPAKALRPGDSWAVR